jgi:hypothetical protein
MKILSDSLNSAISEHCFGTRNAWSLWGVVAEAMSAYKQQQQQ